MKVIVLQIDPNNDVDATLLEEPKTKHLLSLLEVVLDGLYIGMIIFNKGLSMSSYTVTIYVFVCLALLVSKAYGFYRVYQEFYSLRQQVANMYSIVIDF